MKVIPSVSNVVYIETKDGTLFEIYDCENKDNEIVICKVADTYSNSKRLDMTAKTQDFPYPKTIGTYRGITLF